MTDSKSAEPNLADYMAKWAKVNIRPSNQEDEARREHAQDLIAWQRRRIADLEAEPTTLEQARDIVADVVRALGGEARGGASLALNAITEAMTGTRAVSPPRATPVAWMRRRVTPSGAKFAWSEGALCPGDDWEPMYGNSGEQKDPEALQWGRPDETGGSR